ncbi:uncharacterized protein MEPE_03242 [Melanopsichium pennsylvanicum]|uniref:Glycosyltransferase 2-like domain-containing protein n=2 Tax=Melanopsichium pennsylvanicum TaxID=63383 RepID=A0AAJ4XP01_9BASI|nr:conserved hypothetical protein [Melanopsichium pennsylvanicum 4]SNX84533.1 uncharacterized protein MEPE_03242 [Melanopsichium pennsylvanicum]
MKMTPYSKGSLSDQLEKYSITIDPCDSRSEPVVASAPLSPTASTSVEEVSSETRERAVQNRPPKLTRAVSKGSRNSIFKSKSKSLPSSPINLTFAKTTSTTSPSSERIAQVDIANEFSTNDGALVPAHADAPAAATPSDISSWIEAREGYQLMAMHLWRAFKRESLFGQVNEVTGLEVPSGVAIRYAKAQYVICPSDDARLDDFCQSVAVLNCEAAMTITSSVVAAITTRLTPSMTHVPITPSQNIQVVNSMAALAGARKAQKACFIRSENTLVVWVDQVEILQERAKDLEDKMLMFVWTSSYRNNANNLLVATMAAASTPGLASPTATSRATSTPASNPALPTSSSSASISSVASFAPLNQNNLDKVRNHQRSFRDKISFARQSTATSIGSVYGAMGGKGKKVLSDDLSDFPSSPTSAVLRPNSNSRHVSFSNSRTESHFREIGIQHVEEIEQALTSTSSNLDFPDRAIGVITQPRIAVVNTCSKNTTYESRVSQSVSSQSSFSFGDEKEEENEKDWEGTPASVDSDMDHEKQEMNYEQRTLSFLAPLQHGFAVALDILICFLFTSKLFQHCLEDGDWSRIALTPIMIIMFPVILFFCDNIIGIIMQIVGPVNQLHQNSLYYSGKAPLRKLAGDLPHITIQMPVYKESLQGVLMPTIESVKRAITTYELQGGTAGIIVSEDGMLLLDEQEQKIRKEFYERNNVSWVARPGHNQEGYVRKGRFKKASNLNFTCHLSMDVEKMMIEARPNTLVELERFRTDPDFLKSPTVAEVGQQDTDKVQEAEKQAESVEASRLQGSSENDLGPLGPEDWTDADEIELYRRCLEACLPRRHRLAQAKGDIRIGQLILMIDSDTRVPEDCFLDAATEMTLCPDIGVLQHCSGVMLVSDSYFELCIAFFTRLVNFAISFTVANGDVAPFMGHNAILRWSAMQEAAFVDPEDGVRKYWSESHVSEDFDMALRLLMSGYITRWATYSNNGFEEGVSLTCDDELNRWQKYAFGCSELVLHRLWEWPTKGLFTPLFKTFLKSSAPIHYKFSASSYIFSYYAIGAAFPLTWVLYLVEGWFFPILDPSFMTPFKIWVSVVVVFTLGGNFAQIIARYRAKVDSLFNLIKEHMVWLPCMFVFFGGLSLHVAMALLSHPLGIDMSWGATNKDLADSNFFLEVPLIWKRFRFVIMLCIVTIAAVIVMQITAIVPLDWSIQGFFTYWPLLLTAISHLIYPIVLNPALLRFSF